VEPPPRDALVVPCCRCVDGRQQVIGIDTRTAPWTVALPNSITYQPVVPINDVAWAPVPPAGWVGPPGGPTAEGNYTYRLRFYVPPDCIIPSRITVSGRVAADNSATVYLDGSQIAVQSTPTHGFLPGNIISFAEPVAVSGTHSLTVVVHNWSNVTGVIVQGAINMACPEQTPRDGAWPTDPTKQD